MTELDSSFSSADAVATPWSKARVGLQDAHVYWLSTVRPDARPHVTPLIGVWLDGALYFCTGADERKAKNLALNEHCVLTTGCNDLEEGMDLVVEGAAAAVRGKDELDRVAGTFEVKYGSRFTKPGGTFFGLGDAIRNGETLLFRVAPVVAFGFGTGEEYSQTTWRFA